MRAARGTVVRSVDRPVNVLMGRHLLIETVPTQHVAIDGEVITRTPIQVSVARNALLLMVPTAYQDR